MIYGNKVVSRRESEKRKNLHEIRLKTMRTTLDLSPPASCRVTNAKKVYLQEGENLYRKMYSD
jgi:hypothetical protein